MALGKTVPLTNELGELLLATRLAMGFTQGSLSTESGLSTFSIGRYERAEGHTARIVEFRKLMKALKLSDAQVESASSGESVALAVVDKPRPKAKRGRPVGSKNKPKDTPAKGREASFSVLHEVTVKVVSSVSALSPKAAGLAAKQRLIARLVADSEDELVVGFDVKRIQISAGDDGTVLIGS